MIGFDHYLYRCACARQTGNGPLTASGGGGGKNLEINPVERQRP